MSEYDVCRAPEGATPSDGSRPPTAPQLQALIWNGGVRLADGSPVYHALLHPDEAGVVDTGDSQAAIRTVHALTMANPHVVWACRNQTGEMAAQILTEALSAPALD